MNKLKKMLIKSDFFKAIEVHSIRWEYVSLYYFEQDICKLNKKIENDLALCLSHILGVKVNIKPGFSDNQRLVFIINDVYNELYELSEGKIRSIWHDGDLSFLERVKDLGPELDSLNKFYNELMESYVSTVIPLTERVSFCYSFYADYWFQLKDKKDDKKEIVICEAYSKDGYVDSDDQCYFPWYELNELVERIRINPYYDTKLKKINEDVTLRMEELKRELGITETKKNDKDTSEYNPFDVQGEVLGERFIIREDNLFEEIDGVKCVREEWKRFLRYLDLSNISFAGVYIAELDFTGSNAVIDPELVYNKDVSMCKFDENNLVSNQDLCTECGRPIKR